MFAYPIIVAAMIGSGLLIGWIDFSYLWGMIPRRYRRLLRKLLQQVRAHALKARLDDYQREKILSVTRVLTIMWTVISAIFFALGYGLTKVAY